MFPLVGSLAAAVGTLTAVLDARIAFRLAIIVSGMFLADDRRTASAWLAAAGVLDDWDRFYDCLISIGRNSNELATAVLKLVVTQLNPGPNGRFVLAVDDSPTKRYGRQVEGAGVHHHPTPGPADGEWLYGHNWVVLALLARHPVWGVVALPLLARLYVRRITLPRIAPDHRPTFRTKLELAVELVQWLVLSLKFLGKSLWVVADGAYAKAAFLKPLIELGVTVVSRLRKDAALFCLPELRRPGQRGRPRLYGSQRIDLAKRAGQKRGWRHGVFDLYGKPTPKKYKTFLATWRPAGGVIRVVLVKEARSWVAFFCTQPDATVADVLGCVADRFSLETAFRDVKEVVGAGQQQVRFLWANIGAFHLCLWTYTMTEAWAWDRDDGLVDRSASPWDDPNRRPSHADKRRAWQRELLAEEIQAVVGEHTDPAKIRDLAHRCLDLAA